MPYGHASMLLLGEGSETTEPYNKYDKIRPHSIRSLQFDQKVRPLSFRPEKFDLFTATHPKAEVLQFCLMSSAVAIESNSRWISPYCFGKHGSIAFFSPFFASVSFFPLLDIMDVRHQSSAMCIIILGEKTHTRALQ